MILESRINELIEPNYQGLKSRLSELVCNYNTSNMEIDCKIYYLAFKNKQPSIDEFIEFIYYKLIYFCIPYSKRKKYIDKWRTTGDLRYWLELSDKAKQLFIRAKKLRRITGEPGELILYILLEAVMKAPQIVCKMHLKTSVNMPVHGSDAIHIAYDDNTQILCLYWGQSKLYKQLTAALDETCISISGFLTDQGNGAPKERDLEIIRDHITIENENLRAQILNYLDPYEAQSNEIEECHACFVGFEYDLLSQLDKIDKTELIKHFESKYRERAESAIETFEEKIVEHKINHLNFVFFLIPFRDMVELRTKFLNRLGVSDD